MSMTHDIDALDKAATQGEWILMQDGTVSREEDGAVFMGWPRDIDEPYDPDVMLAVALVNAFRSGDLQLRVTSEPHTLESNEADTEALKAAYLSGRSARKRVTSEEVRERMLGIVDKLDDNSMFAAQYRESPHEGLFDEAEELRAFITRATAVPDEVREAWGRLREMMRALTRDDDTVWIPEHIADRATIDRFLGGDE